MRLPRQSLALWISTASISGSVLFRTSTTAAAWTARASFSAHRGHNNNSWRDLTKRSMSSSSSSGDGNSLRVALCQFHVSHEKAKNLETVSQYIAQAAAEKAQLVVLPEIWNSPYATSAFADYAEVLPNVGDSLSNLPVETTPSSALLLQYAKKHKLWIVGGSIPEVVEDGKIYNTCLVIDPKGTVVAKHRKVHLFDIDVPGGITFRESDTLSPGTTMTSFSTPFAGKIGVGICYDIRFAEYSLKLCQQDGCKILIFPGAFNMTTGPAHWELLQRARAIDNQCFVLTASPARTLPPEEEGKYPHYTAWGFSSIVSPWGDVVKKADEKEALVIADLDLSKVEEIRTSIPILQQKRTDMYTLS